MLCAPEGSGGGGRRHGGLTEPEEMFLTQDLFLKRLGEP